MRAAVCRRTQTFLGTLVRASSYRRVTPPLLTAERYTIRELLFREVKALSSRGARVSSRQPHRTTRKVGQRGRRGGVNRFRRYHAKQLLPDGTPPAPHQQIAFLQDVTDQKRKYTRDFTDLEPETPENFTGLLSFRLSASGGQTWPPEDHMGHHRTRSVSVSEFKRPKPTASDPYSRRNIQLTSSIRVYFRAIGGRYPLPTPAALLGVNLIIHRGGTGKRKADP